MYTNNNIPMGKELTARWLGHYLGYRPMGIEARLQEVRPAVDCRGKGRGNPTLFRHSPEKKKAGLLGNSAAPWRFAAMDGLLGGCVLGLGGRD